MEYFALLIPIAAGIALIRHVDVEFYPHFIGFSALFVLLTAIMPSCMRSSLTSDTEYLNDLVVEVQYYEEWDEWVEATCTRDITNSKGEIIGTEEYDCSDDVHYPEEWYAKTRGGWITSISESFYEKYKKLWDNNTFVDMDRDYYTIDGDMYFSSYDRNIDHSLTYTVPHTYENRTQAGYSLYEFTNMGRAQADSLGLFHYPSFSREFNKSFLLGYYNTKFDKHLSYMNAINGRRYQEVAIVCVFKERSREVVDRQRDYWKGGNKNEVVICLGTDNHNNVEWCEVISWTDRKDFVYDVEKLFEVDGHISQVLTDKTLEEYNKLLDKEWERKEFADFDYIEVELSNGCVMTIYTIAFIFAMFQIGIVYKLDKG